MNGKIKQEGISLAFVTFESNLVDVLLNSWWINIGTCIHVTDLLQRFKKAKLGRG